MPIFVLVISLWSQHLFADTHSGCHQYLMMEQHQVSPKLLLRTMAVQLSSFWEGQFQAGLKKEDLGYTSENLKKFNYAGFDQSSDHFLPFNVEINPDTNSKTLSPYYQFKSNTVFIPLLALKTNFKHTLEHQSDWAVIMAHEVGHHLQNQFGMFDIIKQLTEDRDTRIFEFRKRLELQADCLAGVFVYNHRHHFSPLQYHSANTICKRMGDNSTCEHDRIYGTSSQRDYWFKRGLKNGDPKSCDTISPKESEL